MRWVVQRAKHVRMILATFAAIGSLIAEVLEDVSDFIDSRRQREQDSRGFERLRKSLLEIERE